MTPDIDISLLRAFVAVVETGSVTRAARLLNRTQAAVSLQIKRLEELFGITLFQREHRALSLAPAGERLLGLAHRMLAVNDEVWGGMTIPTVEGEVRFGVPYDIVGSHIPSVLQSFNKALPRVRVLLVCKTSVELLEELGNGELDLTLTTEMECGSSGETLLIDELVWVVGRGAKAHLDRPLPLSLGSKQCKFRPDAIKALRRAGIDWRAVSEGDHIEGIYATLKAGLAVAPLLKGSVPSFLSVLGPSTGLPPLTLFRVNLYLAPAGANDVALELAQHIRHEFAARFAAHAKSRVRRPRTNGAADAKGQLKDMI